jgi:pSer/pThr/pTyr-binding forkhead associated (FHA) protein
MDERTQMIAGAECPVCNAANSGGAVWCVECGFRMASTPGETAEPAAGFALLGGAEPLPLKTGQNVVGRIQADVFLADASISRRHAVVTVGEDGVTVRDEGSSNGTRVGSATISAGEDNSILPGQTVQFGTVILRLSGPDGEEATPPIGDEPPLDTTPVGTLEGEMGEFSLHSGVNSVGRRPGNDVVIPDAFVSGFHAVVTVLEGAVIVVDSGSTNGTFVGERRLEAGEEVPLDAGQEVTFGRSAFRFVPADQLEEAPADVAGD